MENDLGDAKGRKFIAATLRYGSILSTAMMSMGLLLAFIRGGTKAAPHEFSFQILLRKALALDPVAVTELGILLLLLTPVCRVLAAVISFAWERDLKFVLISSGVLLVVVGSMTFALK